MHRSQDADVEELQEDCDPSACNGGCKPRLLLAAWNKDASNALGEGLLNGPDVALVGSDKGNGRGNVMCRSLGVDVVEKRELRERKRGMA